MVRFLTYANQFDVEGLVATTSIHQQTKTAAWRIKEIVEAYGKVQAESVAARAWLPDSRIPTLRHSRGSARLRHECCG